MDSLWTIVLSSVAPSIEYNNNVFSVDSTFDDRIDVVVLLSSPNGNLLLRQSDRSPACMQEDEADGRTSTLSHRRNNVLTLNGSIDVTRSKYVICYGAVNAVQQFTVSVFKLGFFLFLK